MKRTVLILGLFFLVQLAGAGVALLLGMTEVVGYGRLILAVNALLIFLLWIFKLAGQRSAWAPPKYWLQARTFWAVAATLLISQGVGFLLDPLELPDGGTTESFTAMASDPLCLLGLCLVAPLAEELTFRDGILRSLVRSKTPVWLAIVCSGLCFGMVHGNLLQVAAASVLGIVLGVLFCRTGDLRLCLTAHVANNVMGIAEMQMTEMEAWSRGLAWPVQVGTGAVLGAVGLWILINKVMKQ